MRRVKIYVILTYHYLAASLFFITVKITETITSTKLVQLTKTVFRNKTWINKIRNKRDYVVRRCVFVIGLLILV
jgi:hypothetical protein